jgi:hypothetical protein
MRSSLGYSRTVHEDYGSGDEDKPAAVGQDVDPEPVTSTTEPTQVNTERVGRAQLAIPQASMCSGSSDSDEKEHAQDDESGDDDPKGKGVIESKGQGRGWGRGKRTNNSGADGGRAPTRARR